MAKTTAIVLALVLLFGPAAAAGAAPAALEWTTVNIPATGQAGDWVLAPGSDIAHLTVAADGMLYACSQGPDATLYRSGNGRPGWESSGQGEGSIMAMATSPEDADTICYATAAEVYLSTDGGQEFNPLAGNPGGAGSGNIAITDIAITTVDGSYLIAVATLDRDDKKFGGVYIIDEREPSPAWTDTGIGSYDVYAVAFSPNFAADEQLVAVASDESETLVTAKLAAGTWGKTIGDAVLESSGAPADVSSPAVIAFPDNYDIDGNYVQFVAIDSGNGSGDVYGIEGIEAPAPSIATDLDIGADITGLAVTGPAASATIFAGSAGSTDIYISEDGGATWAMSAKPPTGEEETYIAIDGSRAYAATSGRGSAVSLSWDGGVTWNQCGLIDTEVNAIVDLAPSPRYNQDETLFLLTWGGGHSLWRSRDGGDSWERVFASEHAGVDEIDRVALPPGYGTEGDTVFLSGTGDGSPSIWKSTDNGHLFTRQNSPLPVDTWAVVNDETILLGSYDGDSGLIYRSDDGGQSYATGAVVGSQPLYAIAVSPGFDDDGTVLAGNSNGRVFLSNDGGMTFNPLPDDTEATPLSGSVSVAFDADFSRNNTVYAAGDTTDGSIYRLVRGSAEAWEAIDSTLPAGSMVGQIRTPAGGALYATNFQTGGGMERCLYPAANGPDMVFETITMGLDEGATLTRLWKTDGLLWSIDTTNHQLLCYRDSLATPIPLNSPEDKEVDVGTVKDDVVSKVSLEWEALAGATRYRWQLDYDDEFSAVPDEFDGETKNTGVSLPALDPGTDYHWRVRAIEPLFSPWSEVWSFTTGQGNGLSAPKLISPQAGASDVPLQPLFRWGSIEGAIDYELLAAADKSYENTIIIRSKDQSLTDSSWECETALTAGATYYWKVRARDDQSHSAWSTSRSFTTVSPLPGPPPTAAPAPMPQTTPPGPPLPPTAGTDWTPWLVLIGAALLIATVALLATMILQTSRLRRYR